MDKEHKEDTEVQELSNGEKKELLVIETVTAMSIFWFVVQSIGQALIGFITLKFLKKYFDKKEKKEEENPK